VAGNQNTGQFSINGQRESANGFFLNGASVQESIGQQAASFRIWIQSLSSESSAAMPTPNTAATAVG